MPVTVAWAISQLFSYSPFTWLAFLGVAACAAFLGGWRGVIAGHFILALLIGYLDCVYQSQHATEMDMDIVFDMGVFDRIVLINTALLPLSACALLLANRRRKSVPKA